MKKFILILIFPIYSFAIDTVKNLNLEEYKGEWFEIASIPQSFQKDCFKDTTAFYELDEDEVKVTNSCVKENGEEKIAEGKARIHPKYDKTSKLQVTFVNVFGFWVWPFAGNYWVLALDDNYQWSIVGDPSLEYLWILSRSPAMSEEMIVTLTQKISSFGYDTCKVLLSRTSENSLETRTPLCELH